MNKLWSPFLFVLVLFSFCLSCKSGTADSSPMKAKTVIDINDGEFLKYGEFIGGEKVFDTFYVTKKNVGSDGKILYYIYSIFSSIKNRQAIPSDFTKWPSFYIIDPSIGRVLEASQQFSSDKESRESLKQYGMGDIFFAHYLLMQDKNYVEFITKTINDDNVIKEQKYRVNIDPILPSWESAVAFIYAPRFMDITGGGTLYMVSPQFMKEPLPNYYTVGNQEKIDTPAGVFDVLKLNGGLADPFIGKLLGPVIAGSGYWVENTDRRLVIKIQRNSSGDGSVIEEVGNINDANFNWE